MTFCDVIPGNNGAVCDQFLVSNPKTLNEDQWMALQRQWNSTGQAAACTPSSTAGNIKKELEKLCSSAPWYAPCVYQTYFERIAALQKKALALAPNISSEQSNSSAEH